MERMGTTTAPAPAMRADTHRILPSALSRRTFLGIVAAPLLLSGPALDPFANLGRATGVTLSLWPLGGNQFHVIDTWAGPVCPFCAEYNSIKETEDGDYCQACCAFVR